MALLNELIRVGMTRTVKNRIAATAYPPLHRLRGRIPRFEQLLYKLNVRDVELVGHNTVVSLPGGQYVDRPVLHATR